MASFGIPFRSNLSFWIDVFGTIPFSTISGTNCCLVILGGLDDTLFLNYLVSVIAVELQNMLGFIVVVWVVGWLVGVGGWVG